MKMTLRWYGPDDAVSLDHIRQIPGVTGIVTSLHHLPNYIAWPIEELLKQKSLVEEKGLKIEVFEGGYIHEDIKRGLPGRDKQIEILCENITRLGEIGVPVMCYNMMPVLDWCRTNMRTPSPRGDGSECLSYVHTDFTRLGTSLPGWDNRYSAVELKALVESYKGIDEEKLWENYFYMLERIVPVAERAHVKLAVHPDDPPHRVMGLPRIIGTQDSIQRLIRSFPSPSNGITFCTGSYGILPQNDLPEMIRSAKGHIHFCHLRSIGRTKVHTDAHGIIDGVDYFEAPHNEGDVNMPAVVKALVDIGFDGPARPDHGRDIWGEIGQNKRPGYGLYDRALGATYINGLYQGILEARKSLPKGEETSFKIAA